MGKAIHSILIFTALLMGSVCLAQTSVKISDPQITMRGNVITISYDILNSSPNDHYTIHISIRDEDGNTIDAKALNGDIGEGVTGGSNKKITWDLGADRVFINTNVIIQVNANIILSPPAKEFTRTGIILQSIAVPGLGLSRVTGKPHWLRGVAGYGCLAGGIFLNQKAKNTYNTYDDFDYYDDAQAAYDEAVKQDKISQGLFFAAAGIWMVDIIWTLVGSSDLKTSSYTQGSKGFSIQGSIDPLSNTPMLGLNYNF